jgi:hypothetical protein
MIIRNERKTSVVEEMLEKANTDLLESHSCDSDGVGNHFRSVKTKGHDIRKKCTNFCLHYITFFWAFGNDRKKIRTELTRKLRADKMENIGFIVYNRILCFNYYWFNMYRFCHFAALLIFQSLAVSLRTARCKSQIFYTVLGLRWVFCTDLRAKSDLCSIRH